MWLQWKAWGLILLVHLCGVHSATGSGELQAASGPWDGPAQVWKKDQLCWCFGWKWRFKGFPAQQQPHPQIWGWLRGEKRFVSRIRLLYSQGLWSGAWFYVFICTDCVKKQAAMESCGFESFLRRFWPSGFNIKNVRSKDVKFYKTLLWLKPIENIARFLKRKMLCLKLFLSGMLREASLFDSL